MPGLVSVKLTCFLTGGVIDSLESTVVIRKIDDFDMLCYVKEYV